MRKFITSWRVALLLLLAYSVLLAVATGIESELGSAAAKSYVYYNWGFITLQLLMTITTVGVMVKSQLIKRKLYGVVTLHIALILILVGALTTHLFGYEGILHIREGERRQAMMIAEKDDNGDVQYTSYTLPFNIQLDDFVLQRYPGSDSPSSYESFLTIRQDGVNRREHIYMNRVLDISGYRIFQNSYDPDERGSVLSISYDPWGTGITYLGYLLLCVGFLMALFTDNGLFRRRIKELNSIYAKATMVLLAMLFAAPFSAEAATPSVPADVANQFGRLQVQSPTGRMEPVNTYSEQLLRKLTRSNSYKGLSSDQVLLGILSFPLEWSTEPMLSTSNEEAQGLIGIKGESFSLSRLFNTQGDYKLLDRVAESYNKSASERNRLDKEILKIDERANILYGLQNGLLLSLFPNPNSTTHKWLSSGDDLSELDEDDEMFVSKVLLVLTDEILTASKSGDWEGVKEVIGMVDIYQQRRSTDILQTPKMIEFEILYNKMSVFSRATFTYMTLGLVLLILSLLHLNRRRVWSLWAIRATIGATLLIFIAHTAALAIRGYISGRAPWANGYESMIFVAWSALLAGVIFIRRSYLTFALATFLGGVVLLVAHLNFMDPEITPLVPVLKSYWLMLHVAVITSSYAFFGMSFFVSLLNLSMVATGKSDEDDSVRELRIISELSLTIGLALLSIGTFLGAIWANESWGRYWGWDPKETWALISMLVYALVLHARHIPRLNTNFAFNTLTVYALSAILMTYFGVNYYLNGLHSYAGGGTPPVLWGVYIAYIIVTVIVILALRRAAKKD
ncbi:MAG: cytochrome c biogenesis protein CcsA [Rikenellaceae bacterium]